MADDKQPSSTEEKRTEETTRSSDKKDVVLLHSRTDDGEGIRVLRAREDRVEAGELRAVKEGVPLMGELVNLTQRAEHPLLWDVEVKYRAPTAKPHAGPARVTSRAYRDNWDSIFKSRGSKSPGKEELLN